MADDSATSNNTLSLSLPTDFLTGSGGSLGVNFNFGGNATTIADSAYNFLNGSFSNQQAFLSTSIKGTQDFVSAQSTPLLSAAAGVTNTFAGLMPNIVANLFGAAKNANDVSMAISANSTAASEAASQASIAASKKASGGGKLCFITTAVCESWGLPDDCEYLTVLRAFRDSYMMATPERRALVAVYYGVAPGFVARIRARADAASVFDTMRDHFIVPAVHAITHGNDGDAFALYCALVEYAKHKASEGSH